MMSGTDQRCSGKTSHFELPKRNHLEKTVRGQDLTVVGLRPGHRGGTGWAVKECSVTLRKRKKKTGGAGGGGGHSDGVRFGDLLKCANSTSEQRGRGQKGLCWEEGGWGRRTIRE